jgi:hypothetical protein
MQVDYHAKYLKYKQKYLDLKEEMSGGLKPNPKQCEAAQKIKIYDTAFSPDKDCNNTGRADHLANKKKDNSFMMKELKGHKASKWSRKNYPNDPGPSTARSFYNEACGVCGKKFI